MLTGHIYCDHFPIYANIKSSHCSVAYLLAQLDLCAKERNYTTLSQYTKSNCMWNIAEAIKFL